MSDTLAEINEQLRPIMNELRQLKSWRKRQEALRLSQEKEKERLDLLENELNKNYRRVRWIQRLNKARLFPGFLWTDRNQYDHEYQNYTATRDKRNESATRLTKIKQEIEVVKQDIKHLGELEDMYEELMEMKTQYLLNSNMPAREMLLQLKDHSAQLSNKLQYIEQVMENGRQIGAWLEGVSKHLENLLETGGFSDRGFFAIASSRYQTRRLMVRLRGIQQKMTLWEQELRQFDEALKERLNLEESELSEFYRNMSKRLRKAPTTVRGKEYTLDYPLKMCMRIDHILRELSQNRNLLVQQLQATENKRIQVVESS